MPLSSDQQLDEYRIIRTLGQGGFGVVYLAHDTLLDRPVAIKELTIARQTDETAFKRFLQEARTAGSLNHPNIVTIYALKRHEPNVYLVMEFIDGMSLRALIDRKGKFPVEWAVKIAVEICAGLAAVHTKGIVHRDIKPENILIASDGQVKISDFGIAHVPRNAGGTTMTQVGFQPGTLMYMSPEQVLGRPVDARSDVYQIGELLYEMLAGKHYIDLDDIEQGARNSTGNNVLLMQAKVFDLLSNAICRKPPIPLQPLRPDAPDELRAIIKSTLAKGPAQRPADARDLGQQLTKWLAARVFAQSKLEELLKSGAAYAEQGRLDDAIREWQTALSINPNDARPHLVLGVFYKEQSRWDDAAREYQATLRIDPGLDKVHYDLALVYAMQDRVSDAVRECHEVLRIAPSAEAHKLLADLYKYLGRKQEAEAEEQLAQKSGYAPPTETPDQQVAKVHVQKGNDYLAQKQFDNAIAEYKLALRIAPDNPMAHGHLGIAYDKMGRVNEAISEWREALRLAPFLSSQRLNLAKTYRKLRRFEEAIHEYRKTTQAASPRDVAEAHCELGWVYFDLSRFDDALHEIREALRIEPNNAEYHRALGHLYFEQGKLDDTICEYKEAVRLSPNSDVMHNALGYAYAKRGHLDDALRECQIAIQINPNNANTHDSLGYIYWKRDRIEDAIREYHAAIQIDPSLSSSHYDLAMIYQQQGRVNEATAEAQIAHRLGHDQASKMLDEL